MRCRALADRERGVHELQRTFQVIAAVQAIIFGMVASGRASSGERAEVQRDHPVVRRLKREYSSPLRRTCGLPWCNEAMFVDLTASETDFKAPGYCSDVHQEFAKKRRKKLRASLARVDDLLDSPDALSQANEVDESTKTLTRAELERIARRLRWELNGVPPARVSGSSSRTS